MERVVFILVLAIGGSMGIGIFEECKVNKCNDIISSEEINNLGGLPPVASELKRLCPQGVKMMDCASDLITECTGQSPEELVSSANETVSLLMNFFTSIKGLVVDLCDEDSILHKNYVSGISCFRENIMPAGNKCVQEGLKVYSQYKLATNEIDIEVNEKEGECVVVGYTLACLSMNLREKCDTTTAQTFLEIVRRLKFINYSYCSPDEILTLKTKFLDYLEEQGEERDFFASAFDFRRRK